MAVPGSGQVTIVGIFSEKNEDDYSAGNPDGETDFSLEGLGRNGAPDSSGGNITLNTNSTSGPDGGTPHHMSEFYGYDHDQPAAVVEYLVYGADDWNDGDIGTGARDNFVTTDLESNAVYAPSTNNNTPTPTNKRLEWSTSPATPYNQPVVVSDQLRLRNTNNPHGMILKTTDYFDWSPVSYIDITDIPTTDAIAWRYRFYMNTTNNKDHIVDIRMSTTNYTPNPGVSTYTYQLQLTDNSDPAGSGILKLRKRNGSTVTTLATAPGSYTIGTTKDIVVSWHRTSAPKGANILTWNLAVGPTTTPTSNIISTYNKISHADSSYEQNFGWNFRCPKAMSTPNSTHYHGIDVFSVHRLAG